jgi:hypothetical protein
VPRERGPHPPRRPTRPPSRRHQHDADRATAFERWWPLAWGAFRDVGSFAIGAWILLFKDSASTTLQVIGFACLGVTASGVAQRIIERIASGGTGNGNRK